jgi:hypothetical protein
MRLEDIGETADLVVQFLVGDMFRVLRIVAFPNDRGVVFEPEQVPVDAVLRDICGSVLEPFDRNGARTERRVLYPRERFDPIDAAGFVGPEGLRIGDRAGIEFPVFRVANISALLPVRRDWIDLFWLDGLKRTRAFPEQHSARHNFVNKLQNAQRVSRAFLRNPFERL